MLLVSGMKPIRLGIRVVLTMDRKTVMKKVVMLVKELVGSKVTKKVGPKGIKSIWML